MALSKVSAKQKKILAAFCLKEEDLRAALKNKELISAL